MAAIRLIQRASRFKRNARGCVANWNKNDIPTGVAETRNKLSL